MTTHQDITMTDSPTLSSPTNIPQVPQVPKTSLKESHTITIEADLWQLALEIGRGNASSGIRFALREFLTLTTQANR